MALHAAALAAASLMMDPPLVSTTELELKRLFRRLQNEAILCIDLEGSDLSKGSWRNGRLIESHVPFHGRICLLQIGTQSGASFAIDILELGHRAFELGLRDILESEHRIKVVHDFRQDADALWHQFGVRVRGLFDCQLCDIFIRRLQGHKTTYVQGSAKLMTNHSIESGFRVVSQEEKVAIHDRFSEDRHLWERRPLPDDMLEYALLDVSPLAKLQSKLLAALAALLPNQTYDAWPLILISSEIYANSYATLPTCRCRLCCDASANARFDGYTLMNQLYMRGCVRTDVLNALWRSPEDDKPLSEPGPTRYYVNDQDESVLKPEFVQHQ
eukprot:TRINITY_DN16223_c4_g1_i1.p1 TRINITY_DN16223_c4_g1~~TRINITY_DN16223_c4_g1_i1.p1  ORF type:complete len:329 (-),score=38.82 TRINITY_DN16223_c4_g1_i1:200-1186(-)